MFSRGEKSASVMLAPQKKFRLLKFPTLLPTCHEMHKEMDEIIIVGTKMREGEKFVVWLFLMSRQGFFPFEFW